MKINSFNGWYDYLSNYYEARVMVDGITYRNSEAAYQAGKTEEPLQRERFADLTPDEAKWHGRNSIKLRKDWDKVKADHMRKVVHAKFTQNRILGQLLIATGDAELEEGNSWHDNYFGVCYCPVCKGKGLNMLGKILMEERRRLKDEK